MSDHLNPRNISMLIEEAFVRISVLELAALNMYALVLSIVIILLIVTVVGFLHDGLTTCIDYCKPKPKPTPVVYGERASLLGDDVEKC